jgi:DNA-binding NarL/FixJ family response regulator
MIEEVPVRPTILVAEDGAQLREALVDMLLDAEYDVVGEASNGSEAASLTAALDPDLVLMDYRMPGMDGVSATEVIKELNPRTHVVMFTAYDEASLSLDAIRAGVSSFLVKGCDPALILQSLEDALDPRRSLHDAQ